MEKVTKSERQRERERERDSPSRDKGGRAEQRWMIGYNVDRVGRVYPRLGAGLGERGRNVGGRWTRVVVNAVLERSRERERNKQGWPLFPISPLFTPFTRIIFIIIQ